MSFSKNVLAYYCKWCNPVIGYPTKSCAARRARRHACACLGDATIRIHGQIANHGRCSKRP